MKTSRSQNRSLSTSPHPRVSSSLHPSISRRAVLRSSTATIALPFLESFGFRKFASAADVTTPPKRMVWLGIGFGVTADKWFPNREQTGTEYDFPEVLKPLEKHRGDLTFLQNLTHQHSKDGHSGSTFWLTGANRYAIPGQSFHNSISVDQVAAEQFGTATRFTSIQLCGSNPGADGHGPGLSLAWNRQGKPVSGLNTPVEAFHRLFSDDKTPLAARQAQLNQQRSVLDTVLSDARSVKRKISTSDNEKLDEYFQSVREIEVRLSKEEQWLGVEKKQPDPPVTEPSDSLVGYGELGTMADLMVAAMQVDASRVYTYRMPLDTVIASLGANISAHTMSHYSHGERRDVSEMRDLHYAKFLAAFIDKLKASKEADGSSLLDHVSLTMGTNLFSVHTLRNCPTLIAGGGAGFQHGRHLVMDEEKTPLCNLWLSQLKGCGVEAESFGDSTGVIKELHAA
ncbi:MAG: DUF1552 domain-containing protein [Verrucomicrobiales bacterium]|nr:DUF1552 domain-containing protein [Verrucomicrobiales bacterium]